MWKKAIINELDRKRDFSKAPEIKALRLFNMKLPHDFNIKNDEAKPYFNPARCALRRTYFPPKAELFLTKHFNLVRLLDYR